MIETHTSKDLSRGRGSSHYKHPTPTTIAQITKVTSLSFRCSRSLYPSRYPEASSVPSSNKAPHTTTPNNPSPTQGHTLRANHQPSQAHPSHHHKSSHTPTTTSRNKVAYPPVSIPSQPTPSPPQQSTPQPHHGLLPPYIP